jgi:hypothetical protein
VLPDGGRCVWSAGDALCRAGHGYKLPASAGTRPVVRLPSAAQGWLLFLDRDKFHDSFAGDVPADQAAFKAGSQVRSRTR